MRNLAHPFHEVWCKCGNALVDGGHADTSITLYKHPEDIRVDKIRNPLSAEPDWDDPDLDFSKYTTTGVIGDPTHASAELGKRLWNEVVKNLIHTLKDLCKQT